uniref:Uncharacterized protein n=1 Tax=Glossina palpalis gambiensis TaxID=67801 RepID=A0A1B0BSZ4_9MUSC
MLGNTEINDLLFIYFFPFDVWTSNMSQLRFCEMLRENQTYFMLHHQAHRQHYRHHFCYYTYAILLEVNVSRKKFCLHLLFSSNTCLTDDIDVVADSSVELAVAAAADDADDNNEGRRL